MFINMHITIVENKLWYGLLHDSDVTLLTPLLLLFRTDYHWQYI